MPLTIFKDVSSMRIHFSRHSRNGLLYRRHKSVIAATLKVEQSPLRSAFRAVPSQYRAGLGAVTAASAVLNLSFGVIVPVLPSYVAGTMGLSSFGVGAVLAAPSLAKLALNSRAGRAADVRGRVPMMAGGEMLAALGVATTGLATNLPMMLAGRCAIGAGSAAAAAGSAAWTADLTSLSSVRPHRGVVIGTMSAIVSASWVLGPAAGGWLSTCLGGAQPMFLGVSLATAACAVAYSRFVPEIITSKVAEDAAEKQQQQQTTSSWELLKDPAQRGAVVANAALSSNYALALSILPLQYANVANAGPAEIGYLFSAVSAIGVLAGPLSGCISDKFGRVAVITPGLATVAAGNALLASACDSQSLIVAAFVWGAGEAFAAPAVAALTADAAPHDRRAESLALSRTAGDASFLIVPPTMGLIADIAGTASTPFYFASILSAAAACKIATIPTLRKGLVSEPAPPSDAHDAVSSTSVQMEDTPSSLLSSSSSTGSSSSTTADHSRSQSV